MVDREIVAVAEALPIAAVTTADAGVVNDPAVAVNVVDVAPAATLVDVGTVREVELSDTAMETPPEAAGWLRIAVQVAAAPGVRVAGTHRKELTVVGGTRDKAALFDVPFAVAVTVTV